MKSMNKEISHYGGENIHYIYYSVAKRWFSYLAFRFCAILSSLPSSLEGKEGSIPSSLEGKSLLLLFGLNEVLPSGLGAG